MSYAIEAFVAKAEVLGEAAARYRSARVVPLEQGFALLPLTEALARELRQAAGRAPQPFEQFWRLSEAARVFAAQVSERGAVGYVEAQYHGGAGEQAAAVWEAGQLIYGPERAEAGAIDAALRRLGVTAERGTKPFDVVGLGRRPSTDAWSTQG